MAVAKQADGVIGDEKKLEDALTPWTIGLICCLVIVTYVVYHGWFRIYSVDLGQPWAEFAALGMVALSWGLVWWIGRSEGHGLVGSGVNQQPRLMFLVFYVLLFFISAWGTTNTLLLQGQSKTIYRETLHIAMKDLSQLRTAADSVLATPQFDLLKSNVERRWANARQQLTTEANCGEGRVFRSLLQEIEVLLGNNPQTLFAFGGNAYIPTQCTSPAGRQNIANRALGYDEIIRATLMNSPTAIQEKVTERMALKKELQNAVDGVLEILTKAENDVQTGLTGAEVVQHLTNSNSIFVKYRTALAEVNPKQIKSLPMNIDSSKANDLGSIVQSFGIIRERIGDVWLYLAIGVLIDLVTMYVAYRRAKAQWSLGKYLSDIAAARNAKFKEYEELKTEYDRQTASVKNCRVKYLWVPASNSTT